MSNLYQPIDVSLRDADDVRYLARRNVGSHYAGTAPVDNRDWSMFRKAAPCATLLKPTLKWAVQLPADVRPLSLMVKFPRVANLLAMAWQDAQSLRASIYDLLIDHRGNRKGFPGDVLTELLDLRAYFEKGRQGADRDPSFKELA